MPKHPSVVNIDNPALRLRFLQLLQDADGDWVAVSEISILPHPKVVISRMLRMGLVETALIDDQLSVRITPTGRQALVTRRVTYQDLRAKLVVNRQVLDDAMELAKDLGLTRRTDRGNTDEQGTIGGLLRAILGRREAFVRWYRYVNVEELTKEKKKKETSNDREP